MANIALILNLLFTVGVLTAFGATLTAPGIAGLVLTIGMAVDTNVIIYERIKEELTRGKGYIPAVNEGYRRSLPPVLDAHVTILLTAIILFSFGLGPVKGFATTQMLGILLIIILRYIVSRLVTDWFTNKKRHLQYFTGVSKTYFPTCKYLNSFNTGRLLMVFLLVVLILGIASFFHGFDEGVEFKGGRSYTRFVLPKNLHVEKIRDELKVDLEVNLRSSKQWVMFTHSILLHHISLMIQDLKLTQWLKVKLYEGLKNYLLKVLLIAI